MIQDFLGADLTSHQVETHLVQFCSDAAQLGVKCAPLWIIMVILRFSLGSQRSSGRRRREQAAVLKGVKGVRAR